MSTVKTANSNDKENGSGKGPRRRHGFMAVVFAFLVGAGMTFGLMHVGSAQAFGLFGPPGAGFGEHGELVEGSEPGFWHKRFEARREKRLEHMFDEVKASDLQRQQIRSTLEALKGEIKPLRAESKKHIEMMRSLLTAEQIDNEGIEQERLALLGLADRASKYVVAAMSDVNLQFTPQQRQQLAEMMQKGFH